MAARIVEDFKENRYDPQTGTLEFTLPQAAIFEELRDHYVGVFGKPKIRFDSRPEATKRSGEPLRGSAGPTAARACQPPKA